MFRPKLAFHLLPAQFQACTAMFRTTGGLPAFRGAEQFLLSITYAYDNHGARHPYHSKENHPR